MRALYALLVVSLAALPETATGQRPAPADGPPRFELGMSEMRTWTAITGRQVKARMETANQRSITLQMKNGRTTLPLSLLSRSDQQFVSRIQADPLVRKASKLPGMRSILVRMKEDRPLVRSIRLAVDQPTAAAYAPLAELKDLDFVQLLAPGSAEPALVHLKGLPKLTSLRIIKRDTPVRIPRLSAAELEHIGEMKGLQQLWARIDNQGAQYLSGLTKLRHLKLDLSPIGTPAIVHLKKLTGLESLSLRHTRINDGSLRHLSPLTKLKMLDILYTRVNDDAMRHLTPLVDLEELWLTSQVGHKGLKHLVVLPKLRKIVRNLNWQHDDGELEVLKQLPIDEMRLMGREFSLLGLGNLNEYKNLRSLTIHAGRMKDSCLAAVDKLTKLDSLAVSVRLSGTGLVHLKSLTGLRRLQLMSHRNFDDSHLQHLSGLSNLEHLEMTCVPLGDEPYGEGIAHLAKLPKLRTLILPGAYLSEEGWKNLTQLKQLRSLVAGGAVTDAELAFVAQIQNLESLNIRANKLTDACGVHLARLKKLKRLIIPEATIGDDGAKAIASLRELREIDLSQTRITARGVSYLAELPKLERLVVAQTGVGRQAIAALRAKHPFIMLQFAPEANQE